MSLPSRAEADALLEEGYQRNPGPWAAHSRQVGRAAEAIAERHPQLDPERAYVLGALHDIGRREGVSDMRHVLDGYRYLTQLGFGDGDDGEVSAARVCITHSFPVRGLIAGSGVWDCSEEERAFVARYLETLTYGAYDRLIQLCDALCLPEGPCLIEKRLVDVAIRRGVNEGTAAKWRETFAIQRELEEAIGCSLYALFPEVIENTFGLDPRRTEEH
ncbi:MAG: HD domain-containing protein [Chloroflexi bacterium]|nr:HD domain-containing protein [Chloroflexota bacterium]